MSIFQKLPIIINKKNYNWCACHNQIYFEKSESIHKAGKLNL